MTVVMRYLVVALLSVIMPSAVCAEMNWGDSTMWYQSSAKGKAVKDYDVFYLLPTCVFAWDDEQGVRHYNADPMRKEHRKAWRLSAELADTIFATEARLYLPYYRQGTFGTPDEAVYRAASDTARADVVSAFKYYLTHFNNGRPFVLAGFSQGARMVTELLKAMDDETYSRMIAAYVVGYGITAADTMPHPELYMPGQHRVQHIRLATDAASRGVTVCFNSVASLNAVNKELCGGNIACINPVSWTTTSAPATLLNAGAVPQKDDKRFPYGTAVVAKSQDVPVTVSVNKEYNVLVVEGLDVPRYCLPSLKEMFPEGNLHLQELFFYADYLRENVKLRSER